MVHIREVNTEEISKSGFMLNTNVGAGSRGASTPKHYNTQVAWMHFRARLVLHEIYLPQTAIVVTKKSLSQGINLNGKCLKEIKSVIPWRYQEVYTVLITLTMK